MLGKRSNKSLSSKTLADSFYNDQLLPCFPTAQSLHRRTLLKRYTLSLIYCHIQTELNNSKTKTHQIINTQQCCPQAPRSYPYDLHCPESTQQSLLTSGPPQIPSKQDSAEGSENMKGIPVQSCLQYQTY